jgi:Tfp pilus assembly protein PilN
MLSPIKMIKRRLEPMADESKLTFRVVLVATLVSTLVVFMLGCLFKHSADISVLQTNQMIVMKTVEKLDAAIDKIPERLASIDAQLYYMTKTQQVHSKVSKENNQMLRRNGDK